MAVLQDASSAQVELVAESNVDNALVELLEQEVGSARCMQHDSDDDGDDDDDGDEEAEEASGSR